MMTTAQARAAGLLPTSATPFVVCVMLANGRFDMVKRAITSFRSQTYSDRRLLIYDTGDTLFRSGSSGVITVDNLHAKDWEFRETVDLSYQSGIHYYPASPAGSIGVLRNKANEVATWPMSRPTPDVIAHWDSDDWSHPKRLEEQVAHLIASGRPCVGYNQMLFWDSRKFVAKLDRPRPWAVELDSTFSGGSSVEGLTNEAWLYANLNPAQPLGTSLLYWRTAWEANPFQDFQPSTGAEDVRFLDRLKPFATSVSSLSPDGGPRMIAAIHGANTSTRITECKEWIRVPEYDAICKTTMTL